MKKIYFMLLAMLAMNFVFTACSDEAPFSTATPNDDPRILDPVFSGSCKRKFTHRCQYQSGCQFYNEADSYTGGLLHRLHGT